MSLFHKMIGRPAPVLIVGTVVENKFTTDLSTHPLGNIDVGATSADKNIILGLCWSDNSSTRTVTSFTVGGVALTSRVEEVSNQTNVAIYSGDISSLSGSQAISVTFTGLCKASSVTGVVVSGLRSLVPTMTDTDEASSNRVLVITNLAAPFGGIAFAAGVTASETSTVAWGTLTKRADLAVDAGDLAVDHRHTVAWDLGERSAANETLDFNLGTNISVVGAGFR